MEQRAFVGRTVKSADTFPRRGAADDPVVVARAEK
jgi:hypothetical protein